MAGVDEVGRGAWAGPLVSAAVVLDPDYRIRKLRDSKLLTAPERERSAERIKRRAAGWSVGVVAVDELNERGFAWALREAAVRAIEGLDEPPQHILLDGHHDYFGGRYPCETIIGGDATELCIAAASIIAKVHRDALMTELDGEYAGYGFARHKGYGTWAHQAALAELGPSPIHRQTWKPIQALLAAAQPSID